MKAFALILSIGGALVGGLALGQLAAPARRVQAGDAATAVGAAADAKAEPTYAVTGAAKASAPSRPGSSDFREITWDDLTPKDWDPLKQFKNMNFGLLNDADPRAEAALKKMRETWDDAPTNNAMDGQSVRIAGYLVPLDESKAGLTEFLLVPYFGACIHTPPPPSNQIIDVTAAQPAKGFRAMDAVWVSGTLKTLRSDTYMGASSYRMRSLKIEAYVPPKP